jgi:hypothetical protein
VGGLIIACPSNGESRETTEAAVMSTLILKRASASRSSGQCAWSPSGLSFPKFNPGGFAR